MVRPEDQAAALARAEECVQLYESGPTMGILLAAVVMIGAMFLAMRRNRRG